MRCEWNIEGKNRVYYSYPCVNKATYRISFRGGRVMSVCSTCKAKIARNLHRGGYDFDSVEKIIDTNS